MIRIKQNDTRPFATASLTRGTAAVDLTDASQVRFKLRRRGQVDLTVDAAGIITDAATGAVEYRWSDGDTDDAGEYFAEWEVLWIDSSVETFPTIGQDICLIFADLDGST